MAEQAASAELRSSSREFVLTESFVWALASLCRLHRVPFDADLVLKQFPPPYDLATLLRAAEACGLKAGLAGAKSDALGSLPLPCVGFVRAADAANEAQAEGAAAAAPKLALLVRADRERILYFLPGEEAPRTLALLDFAAHFEQTVTLAARKAEALDDPDAEKRPFGFRWFAPELARHKSIWRDVLLPYTLPFALTGIRQAIARGLVGMIAAEFFLSSSGIGQLIMRSGQDFDIPALYGAILMVTMLGVAMMAVGRVLENHFAAWRGLER